MNENVRVERGEGGTIIVMSAYCATCKQDAMPRPDGGCSFCGRVIVDEDTLPVREMLEQLDRRPTRGKNPTAGDE